LQLIFIIITCVCVCVYVCVCEMSHSKESLRSKAKPLLLEPEAKCLTLLKFSVKFQLVRSSEQVESPPQISKTGFHPFFVDAFGSGYLELFQRIKVSSNYLYLYIYFLWAVLCCVWCGGRLVEAASPGLSQADYTLGLQGEAAHLWCIGQSLHTG